MDNKKHIAILGSTGSIGTQALDVIEANKDLFVVEVLSANSNSELLIKQALKFNPNAVVIVDETKYQEVFDALSNQDIKVYAGKEALAQVVEMEDIDMVLTRPGWLFRIKTHNKRYKSQEKHRSC